jgi:anti-sigma factor RsiW
MGGWRRTTACERTRLWLSLALDGEISDLEDAAVERHIERCSPCASLAAEFRGITEVLRTAPFDEPRHWFAIPVRRTRRPRPMNRRMGLAAALVVSVASVAAVISMQSSPELLVPASSALQFQNGREAAQFAQRKEHALEPFLSVHDASASPAVPVFSLRALR